MPGSIITDGTTSSATLAISLAEAKAEFRIDSTDTSQDSLITSNLPVAMVACENFLGRFLLANARHKYYRCFGERIQLPQPLSAITWIKYYDSANVQQTLVPTVYDREVENEAAPCADVTLAYGQTWPITYDRPNAIDVEYVSGWSTASDIPRDIWFGLKVAMQAIHDGNYDLMKIAESFWYPSRWIQI